MEWLLVAIIGAVIGVVVSVVVGGVRVPAVLCVTIGIIGALGGAVLFKMTGAEVFGTWSLYIAGAGISILALAGGIFAYLLTSAENRV